LALGVSFNIIELPDDLDALGIVNKDPQAKIGRPREQRLLLAHQEAGAAGI
jgi:hypothetical protein